MEKESDFFGDVFRIAFGIILGGFVLWFLIEAITAKQLELATKNLQAQADQASQALSQQLADQQRKTDEANIDQIKAKQEAVQRDVKVQQAERIKQAAWSAYYQQPKACIEPASYAVTVDCGNAHMRARREFEASWSAQHP